MLFGIADVQLDKLKIRIAFRGLEIGSLDLWRIKVVQVIDHRHVPAALGEQSVDQMRTYKTGTARYKDSSCNHLIKIVIRFYDLPGCLRSAGGSKREISNIMGIRQVRNYIHSLPTSPIVLDYKI
jgi:hypothetical protein